MISLGLMLKAEASRSVQHALAMATNNILKTPDGTMKKDDERPLCAWSHGILSFLSIGSRGVVPRCLR
jgi:hypothetical protein